MEHAIKYSNEYVGIVDKPMRKAVTQFANKNWSKAVQLFHTNNENEEANLLASFGFMYAYARLEDSKNALEYAKLVLENTAFTFWPYLAEHNFPRYARRFALHYLAYEAKENKQFSVAHGYLEDALSIDSPIDDLDNMPLLETRVAVFLAENKLDWAYNQIQKILLLDTENTTFEHIVKTEAYIEYLEKNNLEIYLRGQNGETAKEALDRFTVFLQIYFQENTNDINTYKPIYFRDIREVEIVTIEQKLDFNFPPSYRKFILENGLFKFGKYNDYESCLLPMKEVNTLHNELEKQWSEAFAGLKTKDKKVTNNLMCFSMGDESLQMVWFYCFDKRSINHETGEMNVYHFCQDDWSFEPLDICQNSGFEEHIISVVNKKIDEIIR